MPLHFSDILAEELRQAGVPAHPREQLPALSSDMTVSLQLQRADTLELSGVTGPFPVSFQEYTRHGKLSRHGGTTVVTGTAKTGYLRETGGEIHGRMAFTTASGAGVSIQADWASSPEDVLVSVVKDGAEFFFDAAEVTEAIAGSPARPLALESTSGREPHHASGRNDSQGMVYNARALPVKRRPSNMAAVS